MNLSAFFEHWKIVENPFKGEEARLDPVFLKVEGGAAPAGAAPGTAAVASSGVGKTTHHSDFEKIAGDFAKPATAIVFGEKGSGKTAIRLQLTDRVALFNEQNPAARCLLVSYDDLNPVLDRFNERVGSERKPNINETLAKIRLTDHIDAILCVVVPRLVDSVLKERPDQTPLDLGPEPRKALRACEPGVRHDLLALQAVYDRPERAEELTRKLRRVLRLSLPTSYFVWTILAYLGWTLPVGLAAWVWWHDQLKLEFTPGNVLLWTILSSAALYLLVLAKRSGFDRLNAIRLGHRVRKQVRISPRSDVSFGRSLRQLDPSLVDSSVLPMTPSDETRYALLERLRRVLKIFSYASLVVVIDRIDEPTLISGDPERMRSVVWPMLNNKFLQAPGLGVKMLLPMELRHALFRESAAFFQEARLDKQNMIERLAWTGPMLYDLCSARLQACRAPGAGSLALLDLFAEDVTKQDLVDALDQMQQPRDAFKMLYQCFTEHCSNVTQDQAQWRIPRLILDTVRKAQVERVKQLSRGVRPA
jgi:hypothetical protein